MQYVIGIDVGTSSVKAVLVDQSGRLCDEVSKAYPLIQEKSGYSEQDPEVWVTQTIAALAELVRHSGVVPDSVVGLSFSGQMHGLVLLDAQRQVIRHAILWNDTRTTDQCREIERVLGDQLLRIAKNRALEGFTLPKLLWIKTHEPNHYACAHTFLLPKDYVRFRLTGDLAMDYSDAAGTLMLDVAQRRWSTDILDAFEIDPGICPRLVDAADNVGTLLPDVAHATGLATTVQVFAGGADNACGAIGAGILTEGATLCSIGTSGVVLHYETDNRTDYAGELHFFNHGKRDAFYSMGVTLAAGYSLSWFRETFVPELTFADLVGRLSRTPIGAGGMLFTPYLAGERTPHPDAMIRGSFIGVDASHTRDHFIRAVVEGITLSLRASIELMRRAGKRVDTIVSIGGGAKSDVWLQLQADVFGAAVVRLESEQGPALGAAMLAAVGCDWFADLEACAHSFVRHAQTYLPSPEHQAVYDELYGVYQDVYASTRGLCHRLQRFR